MMTIATRHKHGDTCHAARSVEFTMKFPCIRRWKRCSDQYRPRNQTGVLVMRERRRLCTGMPVVSYLWHASLPFIPVNYCIYICSVCKCCVMIADMVDRFVLQSARDKERNVRKWRHVSYNDSPDLNDLKFVF